MKEPTKKRAVAFFDGQNLFHHAKAAFGHRHPNYDPEKLFSAICALQQWDAGEIYFYTGVPSAQKNAFWSAYWDKRLLAMKRSGIKVISRQLRYHYRPIEALDGSSQTIETPVEKGIDVRLALDVVRLALHEKYDVGVIFSQDQDLAEVVKEVNEIARSQGRWIKLASAFPSGPNASAYRGIDGTDWVRMDQDFYDANLDKRDYRPPKGV